MMQQGRIQAMLGVGQIHFSEGTEAHPGDSGRGQSVFGGSRGVSRQCWEWDSHFTEETEAYSGNAGSGAETFFGGNRGVSR